MTMSNNRKGRMVSIGTLPKRPIPVQLPSEKKENAGQDPNIALVPKRGTWGSSLRGAGGKDENGHEIGTTEAAEGHSSSTSIAHPPTVARQPTPAAAGPDVGLAWGGAGLPQRIQETAEAARHVTEPPNGRMPEHQFGLVDAGMHHYQSQYAPTPYPPAHRGHTAHMPVSGPPLGMPPPRPPMLDSGVPHHQGVPTSASYPYAVGRSEHPAPPALSQMAPQYPPAPVPLHMPASVHVPPQRPSRANPVLPRRTNDIYAGMEGAGMSHPGFSADGNFSAKMKALKHQPASGSSSIGASLGEHPVPQLGQTGGVVHGQNVHATQAGTVDAAMPTLLQAAQPPPPPRPPIQPPPAPPPPRASSGVHESPQEQLMAAMHNIGPQQHQQDATHAAILRSQQAPHAAGHSKATTDLGHLPVASPGRKASAPNHHSTQSGPQQLHPEIDASLQAGHAANCGGMDASHAHHHHSLQAEQSNMMREGGVGTAATLGISADEGGRVQSPDMGTEAPGWGRGRGTHGAPGRGVRGRADDRTAIRRQDHQERQGLRSSSDIRLEERGPPITAAGVVSPRRGRGDAWNSGSAGRGEGGRRFREGEGRGPGRSHGGRRDHHDASGHFGCGDGQHHHDVEDSTAAQQFGRGKSHQDADGRGTGQGHTGSREYGESPGFAGRMHGDGRHFHNTEGRGVGRGGGRGFREAEAGSTRSGFSNREPLSGEGRGAGGGRHACITLHEADASSLRGYAERRDRHEFDGRGAGGRVRNEGDHRRGDHGHARGTDVREFDGRGSGRGRGRHGADVIDGVGVESGRGWSRESEARQERAGERGSENTRERGHRGGRVDSHDRPVQPTARGRGTGNRSLHQQPGSGAGHGGVADGMRSGQSRREAGNGSGEQHDRSGSSPRGRGAIKAVRGVVGGRDLDVVRGHGGRGRRGDTEEPSSGHRGRDRAAGGHNSSRPEGSQRLEPVASWASDGDSVSPTKGRRGGRGNLQSGRRSGKNAGGSSQQQAETAKDEKRATQRAERSEGEEPAQGGSTQSWGQGPAGRSGRVRKAPSATSQLQGTRQGDAGDIRPQDAGGPASRATDDDANGTTHPTPSSGRVSGRRGNGGRGRDGGRGRGSSSAPSKAVEASAASQSDGQGKRADPLSAAAGSSSKGPAEAPKVDARTSAVAAQAATAAATADTTVAPEVFMQAISALQGIKQISKPAASKTPDEGPAKSQDKDAKTPANTGAGRSSGRGHANGRGRQGRRGGRGRGPIESSA